VGRTPTSGSSNIPAQQEICGAESLLSGEEAPTQTSVALIAVGPTQTVGLRSGEGGGPDRVGGVSSGSPQYRFKSCGIERDATQPAAAAAGTGEEAPACTRTVSRNRELAGQGAVGGQLGASRAWPSGARCGDRTGESHSMSDDSTCLRRLVQKVDVARRRFVLVKQPRSGVAGSLARTAMARGGLP
jgi:hypothetical protein